MTEEVYIFDAVRTPRGIADRTGALYEIKPVRLLSILLNALKERNHLPTHHLDDVIVGSVIPVADQGGNLAKIALLYANWERNIPGLQINRFSASGLEAINLAAMKIRSGWETLIIAGGIESMSRVPLGGDGGPLMYDPEVATKAAYVPIGVLADLLATKAGYTREQLDAFAYRSHQRAAEAAQAGHFAPSLITVTDANQLPILAHDQTLNPQLTLDQLATFPPFFAEIGAVGFDAIALMRYPLIESIHHLHTQANSAQMVDGAALVLMGNQAIGTTLGMKPRARIVALANGGNTTDTLPDAAHLAVHKALRHANLTPQDIDLWEINEQFAAIALKFQQDLQLSDDVVNVSGGAIALGYPFGAIGAIMLGKAMDELQRRQKRYAVIAMSVSSGLGTATIIENLADKGW